jgi:hypothetical protein
MSPQQACPVPQEPEDLPLPHGQKNHDNLVQFPVPTWTMYRRPKAASRLPLVLSLIQNVRGLESLLGRDKAILEVNEVVPA